MRMMAIGVLIALSSGAVHTMLPDGSLAESPPPVRAAMVAQEGAERRRIVHRRVRARATCGACPPAHPLWQGRCDASRTQPDSLDRMPDSYRRAGSTGSGTGRILGELPCRRRRMVYGTRTASRPTRGGVQREPGGTG